MGAKRFNVGMLYAVSLVFHGGLAAAVSAIEAPAVIETVRITMRTPPPPPETTPPETTPPEPTPPEPEAPPPTSEPTAPPPRPRAEPPPPQAAPPPAPAAAPLDFGVAMQGGVGLGGVAVPVGDLRAAPAREPPPTRTAAARSLDATPAAEAPRANARDACAEEATRPRPLSMPQPAYTDDARLAAIEGRVRVRIDVDERGEVTNVAVLEGLGHGLDEAAIEAVRGARFDPAMRCGEATAASFTISVRFTL